MKKIVKKVKNGENRQDILCTTYQMRNMYRQLGDGFFTHLDIMNYISNSKKIDGLEKYKLLIFFDKARIEFRNEKLLIFYILTIVLLRIKCDLENICEM